MRDHAAFYASFRARGSDVFGAKGDPHAEHHRNNPALHCDPR